VKEGQFVKTRHLLGEIACDDLQPALQTATAEADGARQARARLVAPARVTKKRESQVEKTAAARATFAEAKSHMDMQRALYQKEQVSRAQVTIRQSATSESPKRISRQQFARKILLAAPPLPEDLARADADVLAAEGRARSVQERMGKCQISAPLTELF